APITTEAKFFGAVRLSWIRPGCFTTSGAFFYALPWWAKRVARTSLWILILSEVPRAPYSPCARLLQIAIGSRGALIAREPKEPDVMKAKASQDGLLVMHVAYLGPLC